MIALIAEVAASAANIARNVDAAVWKRDLVPLVATICDAETVVEKLRVYCASKAGIVASGEENQLVADEDEDDPTPDLCDLHFSLAYGSNILLNNSRLHLKKGYKYGIIANKSAGKTTTCVPLVTQVEGFTRRCSYHLY